MVKYNVTRLKAGRSFQAHKIAERRVTKRIVYFWDSKYCSCRIKVMEPFAVLLFTMKKKFDSLPLSALSVRDIQQKC